MSDMIERLRAYRSRNDWGTPCEHTICNEAADEITRLKQEIYELRYAITGGEDAPGYLMSLPHEKIIEIAQEERLDNGQWVDRAVALEVALQEIADARLPDQPAAYDLSDYDWAMRHIRALRSIALSALKRTNAWRPLTPRDLFDAIAGATWEGTLRYDAGAERIWLDDAFIEARDALSALQSRAGEPR